MEQKLEDCTIEDLSRAMLLKFKEERKESKFKKGDRVKIIRFYKGRTSSQYDGKEGTYVEPSDIVVCSGEHYVELDNGEEALCANITKIEDKPKIPGFIKVGAVLKQIKGLSDNENPIVKVTKISGDWIKHIHKGETLERGTLAENLEPTDEPWEDPKESFILNGLELDDFIRKLKKGDRIRIEKVKG